MAQPITASFGPYEPTSREIHTSPAHPVNSGPTQREPSSPAFPIERRRTTNAKQGRGLGVQPPGRADKMAIATIWYSGGEGADGGELKESEKMLTHRRGRLAKEKAGTSGSVAPPNPSHSRLGWGRG